MHASSGCVDASAESCKRTAGCAHRGGVEVLEIARAAMVVARDHLGEDLGRLGCSTLLRHLRIHRIAQPELQAALGARRRQAPLIEHGLQLSDRCAVHVAARRASAQAEQRVDRRERAGDALGREQPQVEEIELTLRGWHLHVAAADELAVG